MQKTQVQSLGWEDPLEKGIVTHSSILPWRIPLTEEPGGLPCLGSKESDMAKWLTLFFPSDSGMQLDFGNHSNNGHRKVFNSEYTLYQIVK